MMADIFQFRSPTLATTFYALVNVLNIISKGTVNVALCKSCTFFHKLIKTNDNFLKTIFLTQYNSNQSNHFINQTIMLFTWP